MKTWRATWIGLLFLLGCPGPEPHARQEPDGITAEPDAGSDAASAPASDDDAAAASDAARNEDAAAAPDTDSGLAPPDARARTCQRGDKRCAGNTPQTCDGNETWIAEAACAASAPICNSGTCGRYALHGAIDTLGKRPAAVRIRLKHEGIQAAPRLCNTSFCVTGGIQP